MIFGVNHSTKEWLTRTIRYICRFYHDPILCLLLDIFENITTKMFHLLNVQKCVDSIKKDTFYDSLYGEFMVKLILRLSSNSINHVFSVKTPTNLWTNFAIKSP